MTIVKELNGLAEKVVGTNPKATTDAQAVGYIKDNYQGGGGGTPSNIEIDITGQWSFDTASVDTQATITTTQALTDALDGLVSAITKGATYANSISFYVRYYAKVLKPSMYEYSTFNKLLLFYIPFFNGTAWYGREFEYDTTNKTLKYIDVALSE